MPCDLWGRPALVYSYEDRGLAGDVKALRAAEVISFNHCVMSCHVSYDDAHLQYRRPRSAVVLSTGMARTYFFTVY